MMAATLVGFTSTALPQETEELSLPNLSLWDTATTLRAGGGYKDNVFLSSTDPQAAPFVSAEAEFIALRVAAEGPQYTFLASADAHHYFTSGSGHNEYTAFAQALAEQDLSPSWKASLGVYCFYQDQVLDVSATEQVPQALQTVGYTISVRPGSRITLPGRNWVAVEPGGSRQFFEEPLDNYWEADARVTLGHSYGQKSEIAVSYDPSWRFYDTEEALDSNGDGIPGTSRKRFRHDARLSWRHDWDTARKWRTGIGGGFQLAEENGNGYFDYTRWQVSMRVEYRPAHWRFLAEARYSNYDYANEPAAPGSSSTRRRFESSVTARIERTLFKSLRVALYAEHSETDSNLEAEDYSVNTLGAVLEWEF